jgi:hypothetical protein
VVCPRRHPYPDRRGSLIGLGILLGPHELMGQRGTLTGWMITAESAQPIPDPSVAQPPLVLEPEHFSRLAHGQPLLGHRPLLGSCSSRRSKRRRKEQVFQRRSALRLPHSAVDGICRNGRTASPESVVDILRNPQVHRRLQQPSPPHTLLLSSTSNTRCTSSSGLFVMPNEPAGGGRSGRRRAT